MGAAGWWWTSRRVGHGAQDVSISLTKVRARAFDVGARRGESGRFAVGHAWAAPVDDPHREGNSVGRPDASAVPAPPRRDVAGDSGDQRRPTGAVAVECPPRVGTARRRDSRGCDQSGPRRGVRVVDRRVGSPAEASGVTMDPWTPLDYGI